MWFSVWFCGMLGSRCSSVCLWWVCYSMLGRVKLGLKFMFVRLMVML